MENYNYNEDKIVYTEDEQDKKPWFVRLGGTFPIRFVRSVVAQIPFGKFLPKMPIRDKKILVWGIIIVILAGGISILRSFLTYVSVSERQKIKFQTAESQGSEYAAFLDKLVAKGATVWPSGESSQPFFSPPAFLIKLNDEIVQVFEYESGGAAAAENTLVSRDGSTIGTHSVNWAAPPHFYKKGRLIVLYVGDNSEIEKLLKSVLGKQFAGR